MTFHLRQGVKFHDGTDFNAAAAKVNFDRVTNPANKLKRYSLYEPIAKIEVVDSYTIRFTLKEPFSAFMNTLAHPAGVMISPAALQKYGKEISFHPVGTGPFEFVEWKQPDYVKGKKFAGYWKKGYPKVDGIVWKPVLDNNTRTVVMQTGEANFAFRIPPEQAAVLQSKPNLVVEATPSIVARFLTMNELQKPFDNLKVRQAINYAIDKEALVKELCYTDFGKLSDALKDLLKLEDPIERLRKCGQAYVQFAVAYPNHYRLMFMSPHPVSAKYIQTKKDKLGHLFDTGPNS